MQVVVVGGGVIGSAAAYYLSKRGVKNITIVEREGIACAASGKAGGFLAYHWCSDNPALDQLARKSFKLHEELAKTFCGYKTPNEGQQQSDGGPSTPEQICGNREGAGVIEESGAGNTMDYGYRRVTTYSVVVMEEKSKQAPKSGSGSSSLSSTAVPKKEPKSSTATTRKTSSSSTPSWCEGAVSGRVIGTPETTAQCHPELFTKALVRASGATVVHGIAEGLKFQRIDSSRSSSRGSEGSRSSSNTDKVVGVRITEISPSCRCGNKRRKPDADFDDGDGKAAEDEDGNSDDQPLAKRCCRSKVLSADVVVIAMGPWSGFAATKWGLPLPEITGQKVQSVVVQPKESVPGDCLFVEYKSLSGDWLEPEVYPRPDGQVYICGIGQDGAQLPEDPGKVLPVQSSCNRLLEIGGHISSLLSISCADPETNKDAKDVDPFSSTIAASPDHTDPDKDIPLPSNTLPETNSAATSSSTSHVLRQQACFLPITPDALPCIGKIPGVDGAYIAAGHSCWGILNAPATGLAIAEMIVDGKATSLDVGAFDPSRFRIRRSRRGSEKED